MRISSVLPTRRNYETRCVLDWLMNDRRLHAMARQVAQTGGNDDMVDFVCNVAFPDLGPTPRGDLLGQALGRVDYRAVRAALAA
jgi:hypothetical protein